MTFFELIKRSDMNMKDAMEEYKTIAEAIQLSDPVHAEAFDELMTTIEYDFFKGNDEEKCMFKNWNTTPNVVMMTNGYSGLFVDSTIATWVAYECLKLIIDLSSNGKTGYVQVFYSQGTEFWAIRQSNGVVFLLPEEY